MRKRDSGSGKGDRRKPGGRSSGRENTRSNDSRREKPSRSRDGESKSGRKTFSRPKNESGSSRGEKKFSRPGDGEERPRRSPGSSERGDSKDFSKPRGGKSFGRRDSGFSSGGEKKFSRSDDNRDERPRRSSYSDRGDSGEKKFSRTDDRDERPRRSSSSDRGESKDFSKPRGGKPFGKRDSGFSGGEKKISRSDDRDEKPRRSSYSDRGDSGEKKFSRSDDRDERPRRSKFSEGGEDSKPRGDKSFDRSEKSGDKKGFFSKLSRGGKSVDRKHDSDFGKSVKDFSQHKQEESEAASGKIRLNRYISNSGVCSRREADELIKMGLVSVNGTVVTEMGHKVDRKDVVKYDGKTLRAEKPVYILLNKPKGFLTTTKDPQERNTVMQIIAGAVKERVYPVGRLDRNTTGLLLLTNDGELTDKLSHPSYNVKKIYKVELDKPLTKADFQKIREGVQLEEGRAMVDDLAIVSDDGKTVGLEIHIGWNRVIRRIFERLEYQVVKLDRSVYAGLDKKDLSRGHWRFLTKEEVVRLKHYK